MKLNDSFLTLEDEIMLRIHYKDILAIDGKLGLLQALGEVSSSLQIGLDVLEESAGNKQIDK